MERHFFAPGPYLPNNEFYPYSDATLNDVAAQAAINGLGFNFHQIVLKPVVTFISFICHLITGNQMNASLMVQSAIYAILPSILYLFAFDLAGNSCGFLAAAFMILQEWNALNTTQILTIHSRLEMERISIRNHPGRFIVICIPLDEKGDVPIPICCCGRRYGCSGYLYPL